MKRVSSSLLFCVVTMACSLLIGPMSISAQSPKQPSQVSTQIKISWKAQPGVTRYRLQIAIDENFNDIVFDRAVTGTEYTVTELPPGGRYFWRVAPAVGETGSFNQAAVWEPGSTIPAKTSIPAKPSPEPVRQEPKKATTDVLTPLSNVGWYTGTGFVARPIAAPLRSVSNNDLLAVNSEGLVFAIDGASGEALWTSFYRPAAKRGESIGNGGARTFAPLVFRRGADNTMVLVGVEGGLRALDAATGRERWRTSLAARAVDGVITDLNGDGTLQIVVAMEQTASLSVLSAETGKLKFEAKLDAPAIGSPIVIASKGEQRIVVALEGGKLEILNPKGERAALVKFDSSVTTSPIEVKTAKGTYIFFGCEMGLLAVDVSDLHLEKILFDGEIPTSNLAVGDLDRDGAAEIVAVTAHGHVVVVRTSDGKIKWKADSVEVTGIPVFADVDGDGMMDVIVAGRSVFAYGFSGRDGSIVWKAEDGANRSASVSSKPITRSLLVGQFGGVGNNFVVGTDTTGMGLRAFGLPPNSLRVGR